MNPQNIKAILLTNEPTLPTPISLTNKYINNPANSGWSKINMLHAWIKGKIKNRRLKGDNTAD
jgi:hypothetical protein